MRFRVLEITIRALCACLDSFDVSELSFESGRKTQKSLTKSEFERADLDEECNLLKVTLALTHLAKFGSILAINYGDDFLKTLETKH